MVGLFRDDPEPAPRRPEPVAAAKPAPSLPAASESAAAKPAAPPAKVAAKEAKPEPQAAPAEKRADAPGFQQGPRPDLSKPSTFAPTY